jgi:transcriptional regulator with GAF, ATPase, and Fis domain
MSTVLLTGETGTGKELLARGIHAASPRRHRPFVVLDCGALAPALIESELFGHAKGSFTGANAAREGAFSSADGGTVFLDEIGELPLELQPKLLRVLESRTVRRVGGDTPKAIDVRVLAATHRDLPAEVKAGRFREDLFFRLAVVVAQVPPLRVRKGDVALLIGAILARLQRPDFELPVALLAKLEHHHWPGNVRELRNVIERAVSGGSFGLEAEAGPTARAPPYKQAKELLVDDFTREYFTRLFQTSGGNVAEMARAAGIARTYAHEVIKKYGLK